jgi:hypothetical protein
MADDHPQRSYSAQSVEAVDVTGSGSGILQKLFS